jgi:hypothetical protein
MTILLKAINRLNVIPRKIQMSFFREIEKSNLKFIWNCKRSQIAILSKKRNVGGIVSDFKLYYRSILIDTPQF